LLPSALRPWSVAVLLRWYAFAVALSVVALLLMAMLRPLMEHSVFFLFLAAVCISALYGSLGPGLVATALSALACDFFFLPPEGVPLGGLEEALRLTIFLSTGMIISWLAEGHKRAEDRLRERNEDLERWAAQRRALEEELKRRASQDFLTGHGRGVIAD
jgi:K+-sensing histidine kinase KdpD